MTLKDKIRAILDCNFAETKDEIKEKASDVIADVINDFVNKEIKEYYDCKFNNKLKWITAEEGRKDTYNKLYLAWQPGYPMMIADWRTGRGYRDVNTDISINPVLVAYINMPEIIMSEC